MQELEHGLGARQILQAVYAEVPERHRRGEDIATESLDGIGEEDLPAMADGHQAGHAVEGQPEIVVASLFGCPGMQGHPHPKRRRQAPFFGGQGALGVASGPKGASSPGKGGMKGITGGLKDVTAISLNRLPQDLVVPGEGRSHGSGGSFPEPGTAFDVGE